MRGQHTEHLFWFAPATSHHSDTLLHKVDWAAAQDTVLQNTPQGLPQEVEMTSASTVWTQRLWMPYCRGGEAAAPSASGTMTRTATSHVRGRSAARTTLVACLQGPPPNPSEEPWFQASGTQ